MKYLRLLTLVLIMVSNTLTGMNYIKNFFTQQPKELALEELKEVATKLYSLKAELVHCETAFDKKDYEKKECMFKDAIQNVVSEKKIRLKTKMTDIHLDKKIDIAKIALLEKKLKATLPIEKWQDEVVRLGVAYNDLISLKNNRFSDKQLEEDLKKYEEALNLLEQTNKAPAIKKQIEEIEKQYGEQIKNAVENGELVSYQEVVKNVKFNFYESMIDFSVKLNNAELVEKKEVTKELSYGEQLIQECDDLIDSWEDNNHQNEHVMLSYLVFLIKVQDAIEDNELSPSIYASILNVLRTYFCWNKKWDIVVTEGANRGKCLLKTNGVVNFPRVLDDIKQTSINDLKKVGTSHINDMKSTIELYKNEQGKFSKMNDHTMQQELTMLKNKHGIN